MCSKLLAIGLLCAGTSLAGEREEQASPYRLYGKSLIYQPKTAYVSSDKIGKVQKIYDAWLKTAGPDAHVPRAVMLQMYHAGDYQTLKTMIEDGKISGDHSLSMADLRTAMCLETLGDICKEGVNGKKIKIYRSDSGNQLAGMTSDIDHTLFAYVEDGKGGWVRTPERDEVVAKRFHERFEQQHKIALDKFDIATFPGKNKPPDPRLVSVQVDGDGKLRLPAFSERVGEMMASLRLTPGAYTYCGAIVQQMQLRVLDQLHRELGTNPRQKNPELQALVGANDSRTCDAIEAGGKIKPATHQEAIDVMFDGLPPALERGHAYDAAVANYLEFMHHAHDKNPAVKYHLRAGDDGVNMLHLLNQGQKQAYEKLPDPERKAYLERIVGQDNPAMVARWKEAFDVSAKLRDLHNAKALNPENVAQVFQSLSREEYNRRCEEFLLHNVIATANDRVLMWAGNETEMARIVDADRVRKALKLDGPENLSKWLERKGEIFKNSADLARLQLLYSFRELPPRAVDTILATAKGKVSVADYERLVQLRGEAKATLFVYRRYTEYPEVYHKFIREFAKQNAELYRRRLLEHLLTEAGIVEPDQQLKVREMFAARRLPGITYRYVRNATLDPGNIDGVMQVLRAYSESGGDPEVYEQVVKEQVISALPIVGQVVGFYNADGAGRAQLAGTMAVCYFVPQVGIVLMVHSIGEAGVALYEYEYVAPLANATADGIYRGYVGPSMYEFAQAPAQFTDDDQKELDAYVEKDFSKAANMAEVKQLAGLKVRHRMLTQKKSAWKTYVAASSRHEGGAITGTGAHLKQEQLPGGSLLDRVEPIVFFSPKGPVDFTIKPLTMAEASKLEALPKIIDLEPDIFKKEDLQAEWERLSIQKEESDRAQRYRERAKENHELLLQIRRDSLWPYILQDKSHDLVTPAWVRWWVDDHAPGTPDRVIQDLQDRVQEDIQSSKSRYERWQMYRQAQTKQQQELLERRKAALAGEALMEAARQKAKELAPVAEAIFLRNFPDSAPQVFISLRDVPGKKESEREYRPDVRVVANPDLYRPPYSAACYALNSNEVAQAIQNRRHANLPLNSEQLAVLQKSSGPAVLVFAFCAGFEMPTRNVPATVAELVQLPKVAVGNQSLYLLAGSAHGVTAAVEPPTTVAEKPQPNQPRPAASGGITLYEAIRAKDAGDYTPGKALGQVFEGQTILARCDAKLSHWRDPALSTQLQVVQGGKVVGGGNPMHGWRDAQGRSPGGKDDFVPGTYTHWYWIWLQQTGPLQIVATYDTMSDKMQLIPHTVATLGLNALPNSMVLTEVKFTDDSNDKLSSATHSASKGSVRIAINAETSNGVGRPNTKHQSRFALTFPDRITDDLPGTVRYELTPQTAETEASFSIEGPFFVGKDGKKQFGFGASVRSGDGAQSGSKQTFPFTLGYTEELRRKTAFRGTVWTGYRKLTFNVIYTDLPHAGVAPESAQPVVATVAPSKPATASALQPVSKPAPPVSEFDKLRQTATAGDALAQSELGKCYMFGKGVAADPAAAVQWFQKSAEQGNPKGQHNLGYCYETGQGVQQDYAPAIRLYRQAAAANVPVSQYRLGKLYEDGIGVKQDWEAAFGWYHQSALTGFVASQTAVGRLYRHGDGVKKSKDEAARWFRRAAEQGDALAQYHLGECYAEGDGVKKDRDEAARWYQLAAEKGNADAQYELGRACKKGHGVPEDDVRAYVWFDLAAAQGHTEAKKDRDHLAKKLSRKELAQAQNLTGGLPAHAVK